MFSQIFYGFFLLIFSLIYLNCLIPRDYVLWFSTIFGDDWREIVDKWL